MAKQYLVDHTLQFKNKDGKTLTILRSDKPQEVPAAIAKEALEKKLIRQVDGAAESKPTGESDPAKDAPPSGRDGDGGTE